MKSIRAILHPTDFSEHSESALRVARGLARDHGARLILLHVLPYEPIPGAVRELATELEACDEALQAERKRVEGPDLKEPVTTELRKGRVVDEILDAAETSRCDVIVMGSEGRSWLGRLLFGNVAEEVMRRAQCPVLAIKLPHSAPRAAAHEHHGGTVGAR